MSEPHLHQLIHDLVEEEHRLEGAVRGGVLRPPPIDGEQELRHPEVGGNRVAEELRVDDGQPRLARDGGRSAAEQGVHVERVAAFEQRDRSNEPTRRVFRDGHDEKDGPLIFGTQPDQPAEHVEGSRGPFAL